MMSVCLRMIGPLQGYSNSVALLTAVWAVCCSAIHGFLGGTLHVGLSRGGG
jgi:hypothetical protein